MQKIEHDCILQIHTTSSLITKNGEAIEQQI
jgi:hypothetical protein